MNRILRLGALAAAITAIASLVLLYDDLRFWAARAELIEVAGVSYRVAIQDRRDFLLSVQIQIERCRLDPQCPASTLRALREQQQRLEEDIRQLEREREKYQ